MPRFFGTGVLFAFWIPGNTAGQEKYQKKLHPY